ncbi:MAG: iron ABC transporter permease, partial [Verrucomicrobia bacterium]|nr:iron ABC transporter permease [Verrucomicrobiota bacterium]
MKRRHYLTLLLVISVLVAFLLYPLSYVFKEAFFPGGSFSLAYFTNLLSSPIMREAIVNSFALAVVTTVLAAMLAIPLAVLAVRYAFPGKTLLTGLLLVPMIMPPFVGAIGMRQFLARFGSVNLLLMDAGVLSAPIDWLGAARFWGVVVVEVLHLYPILYLNVVAALANVDPSLQEAGTNLGSNGLRLFRKVTLPLMMPGLFAGSIIVFIWALTDLGTPLVFEYRRVMPVQIFDRVTDMNNNPEGFALVVFVLALSVLLFVVGKRSFGSTGYQTLGKGGARAREIEPGWAAKAMIVLAFVAVITIASLPHLAVVLTSLREQWFMTVLPESYSLKYYAGALSHKLTLPSIRTSIGLSAFSTLLDVILGVAVAYLLVRKRFKGRDVLDALVMLPLAVPGLVLAFGYVGCFAGTWLDPRENPIPLLIIAYAMRRLPFMVRAAYAGFQQISVTLEEAAMNLGSSGFRVMRRITMPLISANLIAGGILAFSFAMLEVSDSLILAIRERYFPLTKAIYQLLGRIEDGAYMA